MEAIRALRVAEHREYLMANSDVVKLAGPMEVEGNAAGSLIFLQRDSLEEAKEFAGGDPFAKAGLFASVEIRQLSLEFGSL
jgi:hypothetical protein